MVDKPNLEDKVGETPIIRVAKIEIPDGTLIALGGWMDTKVAQSQGFIHGIPSRRFDLNRMGEIQMQFQRLGIEYGMNDVYPSFKSKEELDSALVRVYESGWSEKWAIEEYLVEQGLIDKPKSDQ